MTAYTQNAATTLLSNATSLGPGTPSGYLEDPLGTVQAYSTFTVELVYTDTTISGTVNIEGSLDGGTTWNTIGEVHTTPGLYTITGPGVIQIRGNLVSIAGTGAAVTVIAIGIS